MYGVTEIPLRQSTNCHLMTLTYARHLKQIFPIHRSWPQVQLRVVRSDTFAGVSSEEPHNNGISGASFAKRRGPRSRGQFTSQHFRTNSTLTFLKVVLHVRRERSRSVLAILCLLLASSGILQNMGNSRLISSSATKISPHASNACLRIGHVVGT